MPTPTIFEGINPRGTQTFIPCKDAKAQNGVIANTKLIKDTVGWSGKNKFDISKAVSSYATIQNYGFVNSDTDSRTIFNATVWLFNGSTLLSSIQLNYTRVNEHFEKEIEIPQNTTKLRFGHSGSQKNIYIEVPFAEVGNYIIGFDCSAYDPSTVGGLDVRNIMVRKADILDGTFEPYRNTTAFPRDEQAMLGAKNLFNPDAISGMGQFTYSNGEFKNNVTDTRANLSFNIQGRKNNAFVKVLLGIDCTATGKYTGVFTISDSDDINQLYIGHSGTSQDIKFVLPFTSKGSFRVSFNATGIDPSVVNGIVIKELMFLEPTDTDYTYAPYAMTNRELTEKVTPIEENYTVTGGTLVLRKIGDVVYATMDTISSLSADTWVNVGDSSFATSNKTFFGNLIALDGTIIKIRLQSNGKLDIRTPQAISASKYIQDSCAMIDIQ